jgi:hypothetical protein
MGMELRRVPLEFAQNRNEIRNSYLNPHHGFDCPDCSRLGYSSHARHLNDQWYGNARFVRAERGCKLFKLTDESVVWVFAGRRITEDHEKRRILDRWNAQWRHYLNAVEVAVLVKAGRLHDFTSTWIKGQGWVKNDPETIPTPERVNAWSQRDMGHDGINQCNRMKVLAC